MVNSGFGNDDVSESETSSGPGPAARFRSFVEAGEFRLQRCDDCGSTFFYPRLLCPGCGSRAMSWVLASGRGTVYSTSVARGPEEYNIALVDLEEGPRMMTRVVDIAPDAVQIGMPVTAFIGQVGEERVVLFRPDPGNGA